MNTNRQIGWRSRTRNGLKTENSFRSFSVPLDTGYTCTQILPRVILSFSRNIEHRQRTELRTVDQLQLILQAGRIGVERLGCYRLNVIEIYVRQFKLQQFLTNNRGTFFNLLQPTLERPIVKILFFSNSQTFKTINYINNSLIYIFYFR